MEDQRVRARCELKSLRRVVGRRLLLCLIALVAVPYLLADRQLYADGGIAAASSGQSASSSGLVVEAEGVQPNFPDNVDFSLQAHGFEATRAVLNYSLVGDPVTSDVQASIARPSSDLNLSVTVDLGTDYIPPGAQVAYYWTLTGTDGASVDTTAGAFTLLDKRHKWQNLTDARKRVSVHWYDGDQAFGKDLIDTASSALDRLQQDIQAGLQRPAEVWVYPTQDDLLGALPKNIPEWVGGKAFPDLALVMSAIADNDIADEEIKRVVPHELSHLVLYQATLNPYNSPPAWLDEGLAVHNQQAHDPQEAESLKQAAEKGTLVPLKALSGSFGADENAALLSYAESRSAIDFILSDNRYGPQKFARTIAAFRNGVTYDDALQAGLGITVDELDKEWRASLPYAVGSSSPAPAPSTPQGSWVGALLAGAFANVIVATAVVVFVVLFLLAGIFATIMVRQRSARHKG